MELIYTCVAKLVGAICKQDGNTIPESLKHYADPNDFNQVMYHQRSTQTENRLEKILADADSLLCLCTGKDDSLSEYDLLFSLYADIRETARRSDHLFIDGNDGCGYTYTRCGKGGRGNGKICESGKQCF